MGIEQQPKRITIIDPDKNQPVSRSLETSLGERLKNAGIEYSILGKLEIPEESYLSPPELFIIGYPQHSEEASWEDQLLQVFRSPDSPFLNTNVAVYHTNPTPGFEAVMKNNRIFLFEELDDLNSEKVADDIIDIVNSNIDIANE